MKLLAINSAFLESFIEYNNGGKLICSKLDSSLRHSENLLPEIEKVLGEDKVKDIDCIAVVVGPGSFTGIRIGVAIAKAFMLANENIKAISINSLELLANEYLKDKTKSKDFWCVLNALSGNYFVQKFSKSGESLCEPHMVNGEELEKIKDEYIVSLMSDDIEFANETIEFKSETLYNLASKKAESNDFVTENNLLPLYLRLSQAEQELKEKEKNAN